MWTKRLSDAQNCWDKCLHCHGACIPPSVRQMGKRECSKQGKEGAIPLPTAPGFYQVSAPRLLPTGRLSGHHRQPWSLCCKQCKHTAVGTEPSCVFGMDMGFATHLASQHTMEISYNQPPEIFWFATVFEADKRGICESTPRGNEILFNSVELLNLPLSHFWVRAHCCSHKMLSILHVWNRDVLHHTSPAACRVCSCPKGWQRCRGSPHVPQELHKEVLGAPRHLLRQAGAGWSPPWPITIYLQWKDKEETGLRGACSKGWSRTSDAAAVKTSLSFGTRK